MADKFGAIPSTVLNALTSEWLNRMEAAVVPFLPDDVEAPKPVSICAIQCVIQQAVIRYGDEFDPIDLMTHAFAILLREAPNIEAAAAFIASRIVEHHKAIPHNIPNAPSIN